MGIEILKGLTLRAIEVLDDQLAFVTVDGRQFLMYHQQDCCESVSIEEIIGDLDDLIGTPILEAEEACSSNETPPGIEGPEWSESYTWTFYKLGTIKGFVTLRWYGSSNGYYGESVDISEITRIDDDRYVPFEEKEVREMLKEKYN